LHIAFVSVLVAINQLGPGCNRVFFHWKSGSFQLTIGHPNVCIQFYAAKQFELFQR